MDMISPDHPSGGAAQLQPSLSRRHSQGRAYLGQVLGWWVGKSGLTYRRLGQIADWATGEHGILISSQLAHLRNANLRSPNFRLLEALAEANEAISAAQSDLDRAVARYGPLPAGLDPADLARAYVLRHPDDEQPLHFADWCEMFVGRLTLPYVSGVSVTATQARFASDALRDRLDAAVAPLALGPSAGMQAILDAYPVKDSRRRARLTAYLLRGHRLEASDIEEELAALAQTITVLESRPAGSYGPSELFAELMHRAHRS